MRTPLLAVLLFAPLVLAAPGRYLDKEAFLHQVFSGAPLESAALVVSSELRAELETVLGHRFGLLRVRYWRADRRTAWILEEIGKTEPITIGVGIERGQIVNLEILEFRESRGWEVRYPFFTDQFAGASVRPGGTLDRDIDGITGATLSVSAVSKVARLALTLDRWVQADAEAGRAPNS